MTLKQLNTQEKTRWIGLCNTKFNIQSGSKRFEFGGFSARILEKFYQCNSAEQLAPIYRQTLDWNNIVHS